jgi:anti-sigma B factor antagonist
VIAVSATEVDFRVSVEIDEDRVVYRLAGEIDVASADLLPLAVLSIEPTQISMVILDLTDVTFIDSSGLSALLDCRSTLERDGVALEVRNPSVQARRLFAITGLTHLLG